MKGKTISDKRKDIICEWLHKQDNGLKRNADCLCYPFLEMLEDQLNDLPIKTAMRYLKELKEEGRIKGGRIASGMPYAGAPKHIMSYGPL